MHHFYLGLKALSNYQSMMDISFKCDYFMWNKIMWHIFDGSIK